MSESERVLEAGQVWRSTRLRDSRVRLVKPIADMRGPAWLVEPMGSSHAGGTVVLESWLRNPDLCQPAEPTPAREEDA